MKKGFWACWAIIGLTFIVILAAYPFVPNRIPTLWDIKGVIIGHSHKSKLFSMPIVCAIVTTAAYFFPNKKYSDKANGIIMTVFNTFSFMVTIFLLIAALTV